MPYFTTKQLGLFSSYQLNKKEEEKLNRFLMFLEDSGVGELIHQECYKDHSKGGRPPYNVRVKDFQTRTSELIYISSNRYDWRIF